MARIIKKARKKQARRFPKYQNSGELNAYNFNVEKKEPEAWEMAGMGPGSPGWTEDPRNRQSLQTMDGFNDPVFSALVMGAGVAGAGRHAIQHGIKEGAKHLGIDKAMTYGAKKAAELPGYLSSLFGY